MIVDIGGGTTEVAVMSMGGVVVSRSLRVAGDELDQSIVQYVRNKYNVLIGERVAEQIKWNIGSAFPLPVEKTVEVRGRNLVNGPAGVDRNLLGGSTRSAPTTCAGDRGNHQGCP